MNDRDHTIGVKRQRIRISDQHTLSSCVELPVGCSLIASSYLESTTRSTLTRIYLVVNKVTRIHYKLLTDCPCFRSPTLTWRGSSRVYDFVNTSLHYEAITITENICCERPEVPGAFPKSSGKMIGKGRLSVAWCCLSSLIPCLAFNLQRKVGSK